MATEAANPANRGTNVQVAVRCRPLNGEERRAGQPCVVACDSESKSIKVSYGPAGKKIQKAFTFDKVFGMYSTQEEVFDQVVRPIVDEALAGFNCTIFAYGQTGTGKTHTMEGDIHSDESAGIVPRSVKAILEQLEASGSEFTIRVSFLELYNEELQDLLAKPSDDKKLKLCEDVKKGVVCQNLEEITVLSVTDIFEILQRGIQQRQTAETLCNKNSSRSHSIFTMKIMIKECNVDGEEVVRHGQLNLVDLAGSECVGRSGAKSDRAREAGSINQSLLTLGRVITALVDHHGHIPYRDSKLTRLLQESLGGKAKTCIIATLSPSQLAMEESMSTLDYAYRAKNIRNQPTVNQKMTKKVVLKEYCAEIESLKSMLQITREKNGVYVDPAEFYGMEARLATQENQITECETALRMKTEEVRALRQDKDELVGELEIVQQSLGTVEAKLETVTECYETTKELLKVAKVDLLATEAVVGAQVSTEGRLHDQGSGLQQELLSRRDDVDGLLAKIDRFGDCEVRRLDNAAHFVTKIHTAKDEFESETLKFQAASVEQSKFLQDGVADMLTRSRSTCSTLRSSIDSALTVLLGNAATARDSMTASCGRLETHLNGTNDEIASTLRNVESQLVKWLVDAESAMLTAQSNIQKQQAQLDALSASVTLKAEQYCQLSDRFVAEQEQQVTDTIRVTNSLKNELVLEIQSYRLQHHQQVESTADALKTQTAAMEQTMKTMLQNMLANSLASLSTTSAATTTFCDSTSSKTISSLQTIDSQLQTIRSSASTQAAQLRSAVESSSTDHIQAVVVTKASGDTSSSSIVQASEMVANNKTFLGEKVTDLIATVEAAVSHGCSVVQGTAHTANTILGDVSSATKKMAASAGEAMTEFTTFLDEKGNVIRDDLGTHFSSLEEHIAHNLRMVGDINNEVVQYGEETAESKLAATGRTPKKTAPFKQLETLAATRDHQLIKKEVKASIPEDADIDSISIGSLQSDMEDVVATVETEVECATPVEIVEEVAAPVAVDSENGDPNQAKAAAVSSKILKPSSRSAKSSKLEDPTESSLASSKRSTRLQATTSTRCN